MYLNPWPGPIRSLDQFPSCPILFPHSSASRISPQLTCKPSAGLDCSQRAPHLGKRNSRYLQTQKLWRVTRGHGLGEKGWGAGALRRRIWNQFFLTLSFGYGKHCPFPVAKGNVTCSKQQDRRRILSCSPFGREGHNMSKITSCCSKSFTAVEHDNVIRKTQ